MSRGTRRTLVLIVVVAVVAAGAWWWLAGRPVAVELVAPTRGPVKQTLAIIGRVAPPAEVQFSARAPTSVTQTPVDEGDHVEAGQLLVHMDDAEALALVTQAEAAVAQAEAQTKQVRSVASKTASANLKEARAQLAEAQRISKQDNSLFTSGNLTADQLDRSKTAVTVARSRARAAELAAAATSKKGSQWQAAVAAQAFAEAGLIAARTRAEQLSVRAPAPGIVRKRHVEVGASVQPGTPLLTLVLDGPQELLIEPDEKNLALLVEGAPALASAEAFAERTFDATLSRIAPSVDPARGTIEVRLAVPEPPDYLRTDMTVSVDIVVDEADDALLIPATAVVDLATPSPWVMVIANRRTEKRSITLGLRGAEQVEIVDGLDEGTKIISRPDEVELGALVEER